MSTHKIGFYEELTKNYLLIKFKYHQIHVLSVLRQYCKPSYKENTNPLPAI